MYVGEEGLEPPVSKRADLQSARLPITGYPPKTFECFNHSCYMYNVINFIYFIKNYYLILIIVFFYFKFNFLCSFL